LTGAFAEPSFVISAKPTGNTLPQPSRRLPPRQTRMSCRCARNPPACRGNAGANRPTGAPKTPLPAQTLRGAAVSAFSGAPTGLFDELVGGAGQGERIDVGGAVVGGPVVDMVGFTPVGRGGAAGFCAAAVFGITVLVMHPS
jgi:hypothetical protein